MTRQSWNSTCLLQTYQLSYLFACPKFIIKVCELYPKIANFHNKGQGLTDCRNICAADVGRMRFGKVLEDWVQRLDSENLAKVYELQRQVETSGDLASWVAFLS